MKNRTAVGSGERREASKNHALLSSLFSLLPALLVATALRAAPLLENRFHPDEALYASFALRIGSGQDPLLAGVLVDKPPLPFYLSALSSVLFGPTELAMRLPSFYASIIGVALVFALGRRLYDARTATLAAWALALSPFDILFAITAFIDPLLTALTLWALLPPRRQSEAGQQAVAWALAFATKQTALFFCPSR